MFKNVKTIWLAAVLLLLAFLPEFALAQGLAKPPSGTDWDLYVYGNGRVIFDILMGIKMLMVPDSGSTGFTSLLLVMATLGFVVLAISAGFDPGKNLLKMFTYIIVVWGVTFATTKLTANVVIQDLARDPATMAGSPDYRVSRAPALVVLPAALTSQIGRYFTTVIETYFTMPGELKMSGQAVGQFNLFGRMMSEANQFIITSPELKKSLSAYAANCVVPSLAMGRVSGTIRGEGGTMTTAYGTSALLHSVDMMATLSTAQSRSLLTRYYPFSPEDGSWLQAAGGEVAGLDTSVEAVRGYGSTGVIVSCTSAFTAIKKDVEQNAALLMKQGAEGWARTGVMVPYETMVQTMLSQVAARGSEQAAFSSPNGFIMQQTLINSTNGSYRQAAMQTGNNELVQAAALSQAEAAQKSNWAASFAVFNNMMGYVYTVLQAFIFAITPLIIIALMIPGLGGKIFVNYAQILIWLTLWQPMLSLINFIITLFGSESLSSVVYMEGGLSMANKAIISEKTSDLMIAAQFLGTMTPLISWGIVKGAMAFTEFINAGVGTAIAQSAGAAASSGNLSMNNMSMDNTSMNKFSTQMSSAVGGQAVSVGMGSGAMSLQQDMGGSSLKQNDSAVSKSVSSQEQYSKALAFQEQVGTALQAMKQNGTTQSEAESISRSKTASSAQVAAAQAVLSIAESRGIGNGAGETATAANSKSTGDTASGKEGSSETSKYGYDGGVGLKAGGTGGSYGISKSTDGSTGNEQAKSAGETNSAGVQHAAERNKLTSGTSLQSGETFSRQNSSTLSNDEKRGADSSRNAQFSEAVSQAISNNKSITESLTHAQSVSETYGFNQGMGADSMRQEMAQIQALQSGLGASADGLHARKAAFEGDLATRSAAAMGNYESGRSSATAAFNGLGGGGGRAPAGMAAGEARVREVMTNVQEGVNRGQRATYDQVDAQAQATAARTGQFAPGHTSGAATNVRRPVSLRGEQREQSVQGKVNSFGK